MSQEHARQDSWRSISSFESSPSSAASEFHHISAPVTAIRGGPSTTTSTPTANISSSSSLAVSATATGLASSASNSDERISSSTESSAGLTAAQKGIIAGAVTGGVFIIVLVVLGLILLHRRRRGKSSEKNMHSLPSTDSLSFVTVPVRINTPPRPPVLRSREANLDTTDNGPRGLNESALPTYEQSQSSASGSLEHALEDVEMGASTTALRHQSVQAFFPAPPRPNTELPQHESTDVSVVGPQVFRDQLDAEVQAELAQPQGSNGRPGGLDRSTTTRTFSTVSSMSATFRSDPGGTTDGTIGSGALLRR